MFLSNICYRFYIKRSKVVKQRAMNENVATSNSLQKNLLDSIIEEAHDIPGDGVLTP